MSQEVEQPNNKNNNEEHLGSTYFVRKSYEPPVFGVFVVDEKIED